MPLPAMVCEPGIIVAMGNAFSTVTTRLSSSLGMTATLHRRLFVSAKVTQIGEDGIGVGSDGLRQFHLLVERQVLERGEEVAIENALGDCSRDRVVLDDSAGGRRGFVSGLAINRAQARMLTGSRAGSGRRNAGRAASSSLARTGDA